MVLIFFATEQGMDGEAIVSAFGVACGPDCLKDVVKRYGDRLKIYRKLKTLIEQEQVLIDNILILCDIFIRTLLMLYVHLP